LQLEGGHTDTHTDTHTDPVKNSMLLQRFYGAQGNDSSLM